VERIVANEAKILSTVEKRKLPTSYPQPRLEKPRVLLGTHDGD
jgi:hypothetical protein